MENPTSAHCKLRIIIFVAGFAVFLSANVNAQDAPVDFKHDIAPILSRAGCNSSSCHGKAEGQNGFKLSVFGNDPRADYAALTMEARGRRLNSAAPEASLLLKKSIGDLPHEGGPRLEEGSPEYQRMRDWISAGAPFETGKNRDVVDLRIEPNREILEFGASQPLKVMATYEDGRTEDVTWLSVFHSNDVSKAEVSEAGRVTIGKTIGQTAIMARYQGKVAVFQAMIPQPAAAGEFPQRPVHNIIDKLVDANLKRLNLHPSELANDETYLRRVYLDIIGRLPTADEARQFLANPDPGKLVNDLLERPEYADYWALKWSDLLRVDRLALGHRDAYAYYRWIRNSVDRNTPIDQFTRELLLAEGPLTEQPAGNFYLVSKKPGDMAATVSQVFLGVRITCAECHQHPYDQWTQQDYHGMLAFFSQVKSKSFGETQRALLVEGDPAVKHPQTKETVHPYPLGAEMPLESPEGDRREILAGWMTSPDNPWFAKNLANRFWAHFLGHGIIDPVDDLRATNPPGNPELLDALTQHFVESGFDAKELIRFITASRTYQLSPTPNARNEIDEQNFSRALFRRLPAEVLLDAVCDVTGVPEKFTGVPAGYRAVQLWDSQAQHYFLKLFGRPARATPCECERATGASISQALHLMNSPALQEKLSHRAGRLAKLNATIPNDAQLVEELYLTCFSRFPSAEEKAGALTYLEKHAPNRQRAIEDLAWSLMNTLEFVFNH